MWRCDNVGGLGEHVACHMLWFLRRPFSFLYSWDRLRHRPLTDFDDLPRNDVPFGGPVVAIQHLGDQIRLKLQFGACIGFLA